MKNKLLIIGASGHGKVAASIAQQMNKWDYVAFLDDKEDIQSALDIKVIGKSSEAVDYLEDYDVFVAIGDNEIRKNIQEKLEDQGATIPVLIHPSVVIGPDVQLGAGTILVAGAVINCSTHIGKGCIINTGATVDHDNYLSDYVHVSVGSHLGGSVTIEDACFLGIGSTVSANIHIGSGCTIGAGAVVHRDITESGVYVGVPAKKIKKS